MIKRVETQGYLISRQLQQYRTSGNNYNQVRAIADNVEEELLKKHGMRPERVEGYNNGEWILLDYIDYVIHVFDREQRLFYDIERIWSDGKEIEVK